MSSALFWRIQMFVSWKGSVYVSLCADGQQQHHFRHLIKHFSVLAYSPLIKHPTMATTAATSAARIDKRLNQYKKQLIQIFDAAQHHKNTSQGVKDFMKIFKKMFDSDLFEQFLDLFVLVIKSVLTSDRSSPYTKRTLDFISSLFKEIIAYEEVMEQERMAKVAENEIKGIAPQEQSIDEMDDLDELAAEAFDQDQTIIDANYCSPISSIDTLIKSHLIKFLLCDDVNIRFNTISLIKKTLEHFTEMDEKTFFDLRTSMTQRTFDKEKAIRSLAVLSLEKLQNVDENDNNDVVLRTIKFHILRDPDPAVRLCALKTMEINFDSLKSLFMATRDTNITIRKTAYSKIAQQCSILNFNSEDRYILLMNGINEREESVKNIVLKRLIPSWIKGLNNDLLKFLEYFNIRKDYKFSEQFILTYFNSLLSCVEKDDITKFHKLIFDFKEKYLDENNLFTQTPLTQENAFVWAQMCIYCKKNSLIYKKEDTQEAEENEENIDPDQEQIKTYQTIDLLDEIMPDVPKYCNYIDGFVGKVAQDDLSNQEDQSFIFSQLLKIGQTLSIKDDAQWNYILNTFRKIILNDEYFSRFDNYIEDIISIFSTYYENDDEFLDLIFELINAINNPEGNTDTQNTNFQEQLAELDKLLNEKYESKSKAILEEDMDNANRIKDEIEECITKRQKIFDAQAASESANNVQPRMETDTVVFLRILHICYGFFLTGNLKQGISRLPTIVNRLILPAVEDKDPKIRTIAIKTLGLYCLPSISLVNHFLKVFLEIIDINTYPETRAEALKAVFDFLCYHGFTNIKFVTHDLNNMHRSANFQDVSDNILDRVADSDFAEIFTEIIHQLLNQPVYDADKQKTNHQALIEHQMFEIAVKGLCKLMDLGRFYSSEFLARLIVIYHTYERIEQSLKQFIEGFFFLYIVDFKKHMQAHFGVKNPFVEAYVPCLNTLVNETQIADKDKENFDDQLLNFYTTMVDTEQDDLAVRAAKLLTEECKIFWNLNLRIIMKSDFTKFTKEQLDAIKEDIDDFYSTISPREQTNRRGRKQAKSTDKNVDLAKKIRTKVQERLKHFETVNNTDNENDS